MKTPSPFLVVGLLLVLLAPAAVADAPEISRSAGVTGGVVVLWTRIIPAGEAPKTPEVATALQERLRLLVERTLPGRPVEVRPQPERVCPLSGCQGLALGALLIRQDYGCAVVALVSAPGKSPARLVPWVGQVRLKQEYVPFREPPESFVGVNDYARCAEVLTKLAEKEEQVAAAIRAVTLPPPPPPPSK